METMCIHHEQQQWLHQSSPGVHWERMENSRHLKDSVKEMEKSKKEGKVRTITNKEMINWTGETHYITYVPILKPSSSNFTLGNLTSKLLLNDCMNAGPNTLAKLLDILIVFCSHKCTIVMDLKNTYQAIFTRDL